MSPKSRGRRKKPDKKAPPGSPWDRRAPRLAGQVSAGASGLLAGHVDRLVAAEWGSHWFGAAWSEAGLGQRLPEKTFATEYAAEARSRPSKAALAAVESLRLVAPPDAQPVLESASAALRRSFSAPGWSDAEPWTVTGAWRGIDVWDAVEILFLDVAAGSERALTIVAAVDWVRSGVLATIRLEEPGVAATWTQRRSPDDVPLTIAEHDVEEVLAEMAISLRQTDNTWPKTEDRGYVALRALAWTFVRDSLPKLADLDLPTGLDDAERSALLDAFFAEADASIVPQTPAARRAAQVCLDFGDLSFHGGATAWNPHSVEPFLLDYVPRKVALYPDEAAALPVVLPAWIAFCLRRRGVEQRWISPVLDVVEDCLPEFRDRFADRGGLALAPEVLADLEERGIDLGDRTAVEDALLALNAERLARTLLES